MGTEVSQKKLNFKLCVVSPLFHPNLGGVGRQAVALTEYLHQCGIQVMVMCRDMKDIPPWQPRAGIQINRLWSIAPDKINLQERTIRNFFISFSFCLSLVFALIKKRMHFDIVHFHGASLPLIINVLPLKLLKKKVVSKVAGAKMDTEAGSLKGKYLFLGNIFIWILKMVDAFIAISREIKNDLIQDGFDERKIEEINNFIVKNEFFPLQNSDHNKNLLKKRLMNTEKRILTFSGRLVKTKRLDLLFTAFKEVLQSGKDVHLLILGDGELREKLISLAKELGIKDHVSFKGFRTDILDYLHISDMFVFPSEREGMPNSLLEAMACRLPVIAAGVGGVIDLIRNGENGIMVPPGDAEGLKKAIFRLLDDRQFSENIAAKAYETIKGGYYIDIVAERYLSLYQKILSEV